MSYQSARDAFEDVAREAVGTVLLFRVSPKGGSHGSKSTNYAIDRGRADNVGSLTGAELYDLLLAVARRACEEAERQSDWERHSIVRAAKDVAEKSDSLTLWRFIEEWEGKQ